MGRSPNVSPSRRCYITLEASDAELLYAEAKERGKPVATVAAQLLVQQLRTGSGAENDLKRNQQLATVGLGDVATRGRVNGGAPRAGHIAVPRWEWAIEDILADSDWWAIWLPRLYELLGRQFAGYALGQQEARDERGYIDLLAFLFPAVEAEAGVLTTWNSRAYPHHARSREQSEHRDSRTIDMPRGGPRWAVWEAAIRHVVVALAALEVCAVPGADPLLRIRTVDELGGPWLRTLRRLTGQEASDLPGPLP